MPKKKGGKGKKKKEEDDTPPQPKYDHPEIKPSRMDDRRVVATVKLAMPQCPLLTFDIPVSPSTKISVIEQRIFERHGGSIRDLMICINKWHPDEVVDTEKTLEDYGITGGECFVYYEFVPISGALLGD
uniref:Ubiquitin-like domain-containing protein n=1 Tax=Chromera velia CCMP2878 TaxID=1169474 RepID=A0A0G4HHX7_9ALVE|eukprot:Cvel_27647.t1-p1 / transcript=Cvel_27647.t1 / gene=Cvel_27647 / organism=Chromera_velia_CCMP2878 / gene_product=hypothetical protein / transcript_product=hypothetical protein / location=Cvel_scaffold3481:12385-12768(+) / protein_length=128 / sequence_SO=supercontig / SO=protein_coding / is_pseudo=false